MERRRDLQGKMCCLFGNCYVIVCWNKGICISVAGENFISIREKSNVFSVGCIILKEKVSR